MLASTKCLAQTARKTTKTAISGPFGTLTGFCTAKDIEARTEAFEGFLMEFCGLSSLRASLPAQMNFVQPSITLKVYSNTKKVQWN